MKSKLFKNNETFKEGSIRLEPVKGDLAAMLSIEADKLPVFMKAVQEMLNTNVSEHGRLAEAALPQLGIERSTFDHACNVAGWLASEFYPSGSGKGDAPEAIADDMLALKLIKEEQKAKCEGFVKAIKALVQVQMRPEIERDRELQKGAPKVVGVQTALFFRNLFRKGPSSGD
jgi:hypothetical protein